MLTTAGRGRFLERRKFMFLTAVGSAALSASVWGQEANEAQPLPSWNKSAARTAILDFVACAINPDCGSYIPPAERIAVFDNDGTLWCEQPLYVQLAFVLDRIEVVAKDHPEWKTQEPFAAALKRDFKAIAATGHKGLAELVTSTHTGMTVEEFSQTVRDWLKTARHPQTKRPYTEMVYQPQLELLDYLRDNGFKTFIVSGGGIEFMRVFAEEVYGVPPEQVIGSSGKLKYEMREGKPVLVKFPAIELIDDGPGKPVGIQSHIGRRPVLAFGNSDGDFEMLEWTTTGKGPRLGLIVHHTDAEREYAYDRNSHFGKLDRALQAASDRGWIVVDMKRDWSRVFSDTKSPTAP